MPENNQSEVANSSFIFTCFGAFLNVTDNPSRKVAKAVQSTLTGDGEAAIPLHELEVSRDYVIAFFDGLYQQLEATLASTPQQTTGGGSPPSTVFLIHFGVHRSASHIHIERRGLNCAHYYPGPDAKGFLCQNQPILAPPRTTTQQATSENVSSDETPTGFFPTRSNSKFWSAVGSALGENISPTSVLRGIDSSASSSNANVPKGTLQLIRGFLETPISLKWVEDACQDINRSIYGTDTMKAGNDKNEGGESELAVELKPSHDAGQYLCNTALFCSLVITATLFQQQQLTTTAASKVEDSNNNNTAATTTPPPRYVSLFIHVVNEEVLSVDRQAALISAFLAKLKQSTSTSPFITS